MKRSNRGRQTLGRYFSQSLVLGPLVFVLVAGAGCPSLFESKDQRATRMREANLGSDGDHSVASLGEVVNDYSAVVADVTHGTSTIAVNGIADLTAHNTRPFAKGDLILIIQMAGATIDTTETVAASGIPAYGTVTALGNAGNYELASVYSVNTTTNLITVACPLTNDYNVDGKTQVVRVPQYRTLTIPAGTSIIAKAWSRADGTGGVVAVHADRTINLSGLIDVTGQGFTGGPTELNDTTSTAANQNIEIFASMNEPDGGEKGESIAGDGAVYQTLTGKFGRGAPANGGGGGNSHNAGGGGGANASHGNAWTGQGVMSSDAAGVLGGTLAWPLDPGYNIPAGANAMSNSEGGGRGGYSYSTASLDPTTNAGRPDNANWGGNSRRTHGGLGGHPLASSPVGRLFMGGGGGAGDGNDNVAGKGGNGGGLVFIIAGTISGNGSILANGAIGGNSVDTGANGGGDAAGGGGGGGTVVVHAVSLSGISVSANGGLGGSQSGTHADTEGPGGGGGGGYIALAGGTISASANGALGGTTNRASVVKFPSNGATAGNLGVSNGDATSFFYCALQSGPRTTIDSGPTQPSSVDPVGTFTFSSNPAGANFKCSLDNGAWGDCTATWSTGILSDGHHTLTVYAIDPVSGNQDLTPPTYQWDIVAGAMDAGVLDSGALDSEEDTTVVGLDATPAFDAGIDSVGSEDAEGEEVGAPLLDAEGAVDVAAKADVGIVADAVAGGPDLVRDVPGTGTQDTRPVQGLDASLDQESDAIAVVDSSAIDSGLVEIDGGASRADADTGSPSDAATNNDVAVAPTADAAVVNDDAATKDDAAGSATNKDAAPNPTNQKLVVLGGGFCAIAPAGATSPAAFVLLALAGLALLRRRRSR